jgi:hypothetical protein
MKGAAVRTLLLLAIAVAFSGCLKAAQPAVLTLEIACPEPCERTLDSGPMYSFEPDAAADPTDAKHLVAVSSDFEQSNSQAPRWFYIHESRDGGASWTRTRFGKEMTDVTGPFSLCTDLFDPLVGFLPDGTLLVAGVATTAPAVPSYTNPFVARRDGSTWTFTIFVNTGYVHPWTASNACEPPMNPDWPGCAGADGCPVLQGSSLDGGDKPFLVASRGGEIYVSFAPGPRLAHSMDGGHSWVWLPDPSAQISNAYSLDLAVGPSGALYGVATESGAYRGVHFGKGNASSLALGADLDPLACAYPRIDAGQGPNGDRVWLAYPRTSEAGDCGSLGQTPVVRYSDDGGNTWTAPQAVDANDAPGWIVPTLALDTHGRAYVGFYHHESDGTNHYWVAVTNGTSWAKVRVDQAPIGSEGLGLQLGHYMGLAGLPDGAFAAWISGQAPSTDLRGAVVRSMVSGAPYP